jgi:thermitase
MPRNTKYFSISRSIPVALLLYGLPILLAGVIYAGLLSSESSPGQLGRGSALRHLHPHHFEMLHAATGDEPAIGEEIIRGVVTALPLGGLGSWLIRTSGEVTRTVVVLNLQILQDGIVPVDSWVYVKGQVDLLGIVIATSIRLDNYEPGQVVARLEDGVAPGDIADRYGLTISSTLLSSANIYLFTTPQRDDDVEALVAQMSADNDLLWAELNYIGKAPEANPYKTWGWGGPDPGDFSDQDAFAQVNLAPALAHFRGDGVIVALLDTGIDLNHPKLANRWLPGADMVDDDNIPQDEGPGMGWGHGTHIAGIIAHIAPQSHLLPVRVLDSDGRGNVFTLSYAIEWALEQGADVINLSLGAEEEANVLNHVLENAAAQGVIVVAAAGNDNVNTPQYPVAHESVIGVTAVTSDNLKADFASYGPWVELAAPGVGITSTIIGPEGSGYAHWRGTSMSTAFVSGAAALARQKLPSATTVEIQQLLTSYAQDIDGQNPELAGQLGGLLDIGAAISAGITPTVTPTATTPATETPTVTPSTPNPTPTPSTTADTAPTATPTVPPGATTAATVTPTATPSPTRDDPGVGQPRLYLPMTMN